MVGPTKEKPRRLRSLLIACDRSVSAGTALIAVHVVLDDCPIDESPQVRDRIVEFEPGPGVADRRVDLRPVAHDALVGEQALDIALVERCHDLGIEAPVCGPIGVELAQDRRPRQARLCTFENRGTRTAPAASCSGTPHTSSWYRTYASPIVGPPPRAHEHARASTRSAVRHVHPAGRTPRPRPRRGSRRADRRRPPSIGRADGCRVLPRRPR